MNLTKLNVCEETKRTQTPSLNEDLDTLPCEGEEEGLERFFKGLPTPTGAHATCTLARAQVTQTSAVTTTATSPQVTSNLQISAPVSSPSISTQLASSPHHSDDKKVCLSTPKVVTVLKLLHQQLAILYKLLLRSAHHLSHQWQLLHLHCLIKVFIPKVKQLLPVVDWREWHLR